MPSTGVPFPGSAMREAACLGESRSDKRAQAGRSSTDVVGWRDDDRPRGVFHRMVPRENFKNPDGSESQIGKLHLGIFNVANARPHPNPEGVEPRTLAKG